MTTRRAGGRGLFWGCVVAGAISAAGYGLGRYFDTPVVSYVAFSVAVVVANVVANLRRFQPPPARDRRP